VEFLDTGKNGLAHERVAVGREQDEQFGSGSGQFGQRVADVLHGRAEVLPTVGRHEKFRAFGGDIVGDDRVSGGDVHVDGDVEGVDDGVSRDDDVGRVDALGQQVVAGPCG